jgi:hypothetical protein
MMVLVVPNIRALADLSMMVLVALHMMVLGGRVMPVWVALVIPVLVAEIVVQQCVNNEKNLTSSTSG